MNSYKKYLLWFAQEHVNFRFEEINSLLKLLNISMKFIEDPTPLQPYWLVEMKNDDDAILLSSRSVLLRSCIELWGYGKDTNELHKNLKTLPEHLISPYLQEKQTFKIEVETFCKHFTQKEKIEKIETFNYLPFKGEVKLNDPDVKFQYIEYYGTDPRNPPEHAHCVFFGRWLSDGLRKLIKKLSLKTRKFIGNTSMDAQLSLLMANQAQIKSGDLILDPFVGSGSLLVAAAQFGGYVLGTDIDYLMLHARTRPSRISQKKRDNDESIKANMKQYKLEHKYIDVMVNDFALIFWRDGIKFDSILTDPPYGIREATEKIGTSKENCIIKEEHLSTHIPAKVDYGLTNLYQDLLKFSSNYLKLEGILVCWFPVFRDDYSEEGLPKHPCLKLIANSEQILGKHTSRRLLTYEKIYEPNEIPEESLCNKMQDFKTKYFEVREETRRDRRMRKAFLKEQGKLEAEKRRNENKS